MTQSCPAFSKAPSLKNGLMPGKNNHSEAIPNDEYYLYLGVSLIDAINEADPELILGLVRALEKGHHEFVGSTLLCLMNDYDHTDDREALENIVGSFR